MIFQVDFAVSPQTLDRQFWFKLDVVEKSVVVVDRLFDFGVVIFSTHLQLRCIQLAFVDV